MTKGVTTPLQENYKQKDENRSEVKTLHTQKLTQKIINNKFLHGFHLVLTVNLLVTFHPFNRLLPWQRRQIHLQLLAFLRLPSLRLLRLHRPSHLLQYLNLT